MPNNWNYVLNQKYLVKYKINIVEIYELTSKGKNDIFFKFKTQEVISHIEINPFVENIFLISFYNRICEIYNISNKSDKGEIHFETIKDDYVQYSHFNIFNPNIIATLNLNNDIFIWDVRKPFLINKIVNSEEICKIKWSHYGENYIEIENNSNEVMLADIYSNKYKAEVELKGVPINYLFVREHYFIIINNENIEKTNFNDKDDSKKKIIKIKKIVASDDNFIKDYNILVVMTEQIIYFIGITEFCVIIKDDFFKFYDSYFFYIKGDNEVGLKYINKLKLIDECTFKLNVTKKEKNDNENLINIKNNFYEKYFKKIYNLLNFDRNVGQAREYSKNYMRIKEIEYFFNKIKNDNIFIRKDFVKQILNHEIVDNKINNVNDELNAIRFLKIRDYTKLFKLDDIHSRKDEFMKKMTKDSCNDNFIKDFYIEIIKLLTIDNTNVKLLEIYLLFLSLNEQKLIDIFSEKNIEKYNEEVEYYSVCFSKDEYKALYGKDKESEKDKLFKFLSDACNLNNFDYNNIELAKLIDKIKNVNPKFPKFNQPIEYDCENNELLWFSIKIHILKTFLNIKLEEKEQIKLLKLRKGVKIVFKDKKLLENKGIIENKYKLQSALLLITNPYQHNDDSSDFFCNSLQCKRNSLDELKKKFKINNENILEYNGEKFSNINDICIPNLSFKNYKKDEKYNFICLMNNYVKNQNDIKLFLKNILKQTVFVDVYEILYGNRNSKFLDERYLDEFIDKRLNFVAIRPSKTLSITDKISLNSLISTKRRKINKNTDKISKEHLTEILNTSNYVVNGEYESFHILSCLPHYENNCSISINTPRNKDFEEVESGHYFEFLLFNKIIESITLGEALFILNEDNYKKSLIDFKTDFENKNIKDLVIKGVFSDFNKYLDLDSITFDELNKTFIENKAVYNSASVLDSYIENYLEDDVIGKDYYD